MSKAHMACLFVKALAKSKWPDDARSMETNVVSWLASIDNADDTGSHKYIPAAARLSADLGMDEDSGVYGYRKYPDGSYLLLTCNGVAYWDGDESKAMADE